MLTQLPCLAAVAAAYFATVKVARWLATWLAAASLWLGCLE
jgi:hypothetical protein